MPNHCVNTLKIKGKLQHRQEFVDKNKGFDWNDRTKQDEYKELSFHAQVPVPQKHINANAQNSAENGWYGWCNKNWGTKWDCYDEGGFHDESRTSYTFTTAWSPPSEWIQKVSRKFPHLEFEVEWGEEGGEGGHFVIIKGKLKQETQMTTTQWENYFGVEV